jgi:hypothetical protein
MCNEDNWKDITKECYETETYPEKPASMVYGLWDLEVQQPEAKQITRY